MRFLTLWITVLSVLAGAGGALTTLLGTFGQATYVSYVLLAAGAAGAITAQLLHVFDVQTVPLDAGTVRIITAINGVVGSVYFVLGGIVATLPPSGGLGRLGPAAIALVGFIQTISTGVLHQVDANVNLPTPVLPSPTPSPRPSTSPAGYVPIATA